MSRLFQSTRETNKIEECPAWISILRETNQKSMSGLNRKTRETEQIKVCPG